MTGGTSSKLLHQSTAATAFIETGVAPTVQQIEASEDICLPCVPLACSTRNRQRRSGAVSEGHAPLSGSPTNSFKLFAIMRFATVLRAVRHD